MSEYKFLIFWFIALLGCPIGIYLAINYRKFERFLFFMMIFLTASAFPWFDINFMSMEWYRGTTRGFEVTVLDLIGIILLGVCLISPRHKKKFTFIPYNFPFMLALLFLGLCSVLLGSPKIYGFFELHKWIRGAYVYFIIVNYVKDESDFRVAINALMSIMFYEAFIGLKQHYLDGMYRIAGTMPHSNTLGSYANMVIAVLMAIAVDYNEKIKNRYLYYGLASIAGAICVVLSFSRGAIFTLPVALVLILIGSFYKRITTRKVTTLMVILFLGLLLSIKASHGIIDRFINAPESSGESRKEYKQVAKLMIQDYPFFGVGLNNFSDSTLTVYGPRTAMYCDNGTPAHNIFYLTISEGGIFTFILFIVIWGRFIFLGIRTVLTRKQSLSSSMVLGITCSFITLGMQNWLEYVYRQTPIYFLFNTFAGLIVVGYSLSTNKTAEPNEQKSLPQKNRPVRRDYVNAKLSQISSSNYK
ncbi:MAG TPA: hypothetical protein DCS13_08095, partial [Candidatus Margulisbacteria bacterium]|nr:hypothetical protein [Candidatus Margulisiibacteriota bacterium]